MNELQQAREQINEYYRKEPVEFIEEYVQIEQKLDGGGVKVRPFILWEAQKQAVDSLLGNRKNVILKARQLGFSWLILAMSAWTMNVNYGFNIGAISRSEVEAKELVRRLELILSKMPDIVREEKEADGWNGAVYKATSLDVTIDFRNGKPASTFKAFLSSPSAGRGFTFDWLILDEWAFHSNAEEIWTSLFPTVNDGYAKVIGLSTIYRGTLFESIFTTPDNGFNKIFFPWSADPRRDAKWYNDTVGALGSEKTLQEYPATIEEALMVPGGQMFPEITRDYHREHDSFWDEPVIRYVHIDYGLDMFSCHWTAVNSRGYARTYREYDAPNLTIGAACDVYRDLNNGEDIFQILAPPDLWNRDQVTGRSRADIFREHGMNLTKVSNDFAAGVACMKNWFRYDEEGTPYWTFEDAPKLFKCLQKILKDPKKPDVYAKQPHDLTHDCDSLRYFCVYYISPAEARKSIHHKEWPQDLLEDYENASDEIRSVMVKLYGEPY